MSACFAAATDLDWRKDLAGVIATPDEAAKSLRPGQRVFVGTGCAEPVELIRAMVRQSPKLEDIEVIHLLTSGEAPYADKSLHEQFHVNSFFISENVREAIQDGLGDYTPVFLSDIPRLFNSGRIPLDVALIQVSPPNENGCCSLGVSVDIVKSAAENASLVIAEVNPQMPRTHGPNLINVYDIDVLVPVDYPILTYPKPESDPTTAQIAEFAASLIDDGATLEFGIGRVPHAIAGFLHEKKDLGIHTEMLTDTIVDLVEAGVINGSRKTVDQGKIVASFCQGTQRLYDYIHDNPRFSFCPTEYVNDPAVIAKQQKMTAINVALEVDLTGQVCADSIGSKFFSGIGGQVDFNRGAARSPGGKAIIALPSTAKQGTVSRIVSRLSPGAGVTTTRGDVHYVVTEYGVAYLHGKSVQERALALLSIAHPKYRSELLAEAIEAKYVSADLASFGERLAFPTPRLRTSMLLDDGTQINFRPIRPTDVPKVRELFHRLSRQSLYYRFMSGMKMVQKRQIQEFTFIDHRRETALVGTLADASGEEIIAIGRYYLDVKTNRAEVAFVVQDSWQNRGIGSFLCRHLARIARQNGIKGFTAEVLSENRPMQAVFDASNFHLRSRVKGGVIHFEMDFE